MGCTCTIKIIRQSTKYGTPSSPIKRCQHRCSSSSSTGGTSIFLNINCCPLSQNAIVSGNTTNEKTHLLLLLFLRAAMAASFGHGCRKSKPHILLLPCCRRSFAGQPWLLSWLPPLPLPSSNPANPSPARPLLLPKLCHKSLPAANPPSCSSSSQLWLFTKIQNPSPRDQLPLPANMAAAAILFLPAAFFLFSVQKPIAGEPTAAMAAAVQNPGSHVAAVNPSKPAVASPSSPPPVVQACHCRPQNPPLPAAHESAKPSCLLPVAHCRPKYQQRFHLLRRDIAAAAHRPNYSHHV